MPTVVSGDSDKMIVATAVTVTTMVSGDSCGKGGKGDSDMGSDGDDTDTQRRHTAETVVQ